MFKVKYNGGPDAGQIKQEPFVPRSCIRRGPTGNGIYIRTDFDKGTRSASMEWKPADCNQDQKYG